MATQELSEAEIWDDSALVDSWNEAFEEYKKYHSLAAKGEKVRLNLDKPAESLINGDPPSVNRDLETQPAVTDEAQDDNRVSAEEVQQPVVVPTRAPVPSKIPDAMLSSVANEDVKNLMLSWYYAGYYTGLYEGKQQGYASAMQRQEG